jgi:Raf kinase inhibitor-like YbhB/YbcL family protein
MSDEFTLESPAFAPGAAIPRAHTCQGEDLSPPLRWRDPPHGVGAYALIVDDRSAGGFVHWVVGDIGPDVTELPEGLRGGSTPATVAQGRNDFGRVGWGGPCPPPGSGDHVYVFTLYALSGPLGLGAGTTATDVRRAASGRTLGTAVLEGTYRR